eukprot:1156753-Pelagomonas_calceolata.AAC.2
MLACGRLCRKEDENAAQVIENLAEQITRKQAELRVKQGQVNTNNQTIDNLLAQASILMARGMVNKQPSHHTIPTHHMMPTLYATPTFQAKLTQHTNPLSTQSSCRS